MRRHLAGLEEVASSPSLDLRLGFLEDPSRLSLAWVSTQLDSARIGHQVEVSKHSSSNLVIALSSGVRLHFGKCCEATASILPGEYQMLAFGLADVPPSSAPR